MNGAVPQVVSQQARAIALVFCRPKAMKTKREQGRGRSNEREQGSELQGLSASAKAANRRPWNFCKRLDSEESERRCWTERTPSVPLRHWHQATTTIHPSYPPFPHGSLLPCLTQREILMTSCSSLPARRKRSAREASRIALPNDAKPSKPSLCSLLASPFPDAA